MTLISAAINSHPNFIMETQLMDDFDPSFLYEWKTAEEDLEFLDYTYCFEVDNPNKRTAARAAATTTTISLTDCNGKNADEKQTILNVSLEKLRRIEDPENCLRRTVLISNTVKRIRSCRTSSELRVLKDKESSCFPHSHLPCKRPRLHVTDLLNSNTTADNLKSDYENYQGLITKQDCTSTKETCNQNLIPAGNSLCHLPLTLATTAEAETKRNCDPVRFNGIELPNVICALET